MRYFNKKTGAILDSPSKCYGGQWVEYDKKDVAQEVPKEKVEVKEEVKKESSELTKEEIMNELEALGIDYDKKAKKEDLVKLMMGE